jgi:GntR family transcriptional regulator
MVQLAHGFGNGKIRDRYLHSRKPLDGFVKLYQCTHTLELIWIDPREVDITINLTDGVPIYRQIVTQVKYLVASGLLKPGEELPPIRTLALQLKVTPNTIVKAYGELEISGVIQKRQGSGTFVSEARAQQVALRERRRVIEQRIDSLLAEAHQLNFAAEDILRMVRERKAAMDETAAEPADVKKEGKR